MAKKPTTPKTLVAKELATKVKISHHSQESNNFGGSPQVLKAMYLAMLANTGITLYPQRWYKTANAEGNDETAGVVFATADLTSVKTLSLDFQSVGRMKFSEGIAEGESIIAYAGADEEHPGWKKEDNVPTLEIAKIEVRLRDGSPAYPLNSYKAFTTWQELIGSRPVENEEDETITCAMPGQPNVLDQSKFNVFNERLQEVLKSGIKDEVVLATDLDTVEEINNSEKTVIFPTLQYTVKDFSTKG